VGKDEEKGPLGRKRSRREYNIKITLGYVGNKYVEWIHILYVRDQWLNHE
jgi:hypothetical protein